jgi:DNA-binding FadR family transcriptional regulator
MALKQLQRMNLVVVRHGSGVEVSDYRERGGLDVLGAMFALDEVPLDPVLVLEAIDFWQEGFAMIAARAISRMTVEDLRCIEVLLDRSLRNVDDLDAFLDAQLAIQEELARLSGSVMFRMLSNSTRSVRRRIMRLLPATVDMTASLTEMKRLLRLAVATRPGESAIRAGLLEALGQQSEPLRRQLLLGEPEKKKVQKKKGERHGDGSGRAAAHRGGAGRRLR